MRKLRSASKRPKVIANKLQVPYFFAYSKDAADENGHDTPILGFVEKMYVLDESSEDYIGNEKNHEDYTAAVFGVIKAYKSEGSAEIIDNVIPQGNADNNAVVNSVDEPTDSAQPAVNNTRIYVDTGAWTDCQYHLHHFPLFDKLRGPNPARFLH